MRRTVLLFAVIMLLLSACNSTPDISKDMTETLTSNQGCGFSIYTFTDLDEYNRFFADIENLPDGIPENFIKWEDLDFLGEFRSFGFERSFASYRYGGSGVSLYIYHNLADNPNGYHAAGKNLPVRSVTADMTSMSKVLGGAESNFVINRNGLNYVYLPSGSLNYISWYANGIEYALTGSLHKYPEIELPPLIERLLSVSDAEFNTAVAELKKNLETE